MHTIEIRIPDVDSQEIVRSTLAGGPDHIVVLHVAEQHRGAAIPVIEAFRNTGIDVQGINPAYEQGRVAQTLQRHIDAVSILPDIFDGHAMRVLYVTGWGADPRAADTLLAALYPHVAKRPNLRLVVMNNASPVPPIFTQSGPTAHPNPNEFAGHVARLARIDRGHVHVHVLERTDEM